MIAKKASAMCLAKRRAPPILSRIMSASFAARAALLIDDRGPGLVRVEAIHLLELLQRVRAQVLLVDHTGVTHHERLETGLTVLGRGSDERKASEHDAFHDVVHGAKRSRGPLTLQYLEEVSVVWIGFQVVALLDRLCDLLANRPTPGAIGVLPGEPVLLAGTADDVLCVLRRLVPLALAVSEIELRVHVAFADGDRIELVTSNAPVHKLLAPRRGIERPTPVVLHNGERKGPVLLADQQVGARVGLGVERHLLLLARLRGELLGTLTVLRVLTRKHEI